VADRRSGFTPERFNSLGRQQPGIVSRMLDMDEQQPAPEAKGFT